MNREPIGSRGLCGSEVKPLSWKGLAAMMIRLSQNPDVVGEIEERCLLIRKNDTEGIDPYRSCYAVISVRGDWVWNVVEMELLRL